MTEAVDFHPIFFEVFEPLPRQGPGTRACAERALGFCTDLPRAPRVIDLGCGAGAQTMHLAELTDGTIVAIDAHEPLVIRLQETIAEQGLSDRVLARVGDMAEPGQPSQSFDLVWSEGALYNIGLPTALPVCRDLLRPGGYVAFTDAVWRNDDPPAEARALFADYPTMGTVDDALAAVTDAGLVPVGHFLLPDDAWWQDFYAPMERRIADLRQVYSGDAAAQRVLDELAEEPELHRRHGDTYGYAFVVARRPE